MPSKLYLSKKWLERKFILERWTEADIANHCGVTQVTINRKLREFGLRR